MSPHTAAQSPNIPASDELSPAHKRLVVESFAQVSPAAGLVARLFFWRLSEISPATLAMFPGDTEEQCEKLVSSLNLAVASLDRFEDIVPSLKLLGAHNRALGVEPMHYGLVAEALLWTLANALGPRFTAECRDAWVALFTRLGEVMTAPGHP
ncbi:MAG: globin domain-containing protein [Hyphomicrobiales bacterium]